MEERIQKIVSARAGISRRAADKLVEEGKIETEKGIAKPGDKVDADTAVVYLDGNLLEAKKEHFIYIMLNKPIGYVTTMSDEKNRKTVLDLVSELGERVYPVGRLDINSEGLLIMTNDGQLANRLMHPSFENEKTYRVTATGDAAQGLKKLRESSQLDGEPISTPIVRMHKEYEKYFVLDITIHEGKNRQIRRMCEAAGLNVKRLIRISEGGIKMGGLKKGTWRYLTDKEINELKGLKFE